MLEFPIGIRLVHSDYIQKQEKPYSQSEEMVRPMCGCYFCFNFTLLSLLKE